MKKKLFEINSQIFSQKLTWVFFSLLTLIPIFNSLADGTKDVSPNSTQIASLSINPNTGVGSYLGAADEDRIYIRIGDFTTEKLYFGLGNFFRTTAAGTPINDVFYRIRNSAGAVVAGPAAVPTSTISTYDQAIKGPNIAGTAPLGYTPLVFSPTANGDYYIELYRSTDMGATQVAAGTNSANVFHAPFFDFTVASATGTRIPGRIYSQKWSFRATDPASATPYVGEFDDPISPTLYSYTADRLVAKVEFDDIQPLAFIPAFNSYGINTAGVTDPLITRKSITSGATSPSLPNSFKTFLTYPDPGQYPPAVLAGAPILQSITGCPGAYTVNYTNTAPGDVKIVFDLNGTAGYQAGTSDVLFERLDVPAGAQTIAWDGKDGLGNPVAGNTPFISNVSLLRGRFNMPLYDAELNVNGFKISVVTPIAVPNVKLFWDDSDATRMTAITGQGANLNQTTGVGINNSVIGQVSPGHAWNGNYGTTLQGPPAVSNGGSGSATPTDGSDDFGNLRTINTWFWVLDENSGNGALRTPACLNLSGSLFNDNDALNDNAVDGALYTSTGEFAVLLNSIGQVVKSVPIVNGVYNFTNVDSGDYKMIITKTQPADGATGITPSAPNGYIFTGEGLTTPGDGTVDGSISFSLVNSNVSNINFGIVDCSATTAPTITSTSCANPTGNVVLGGLPSSGTYSLTRNPGAVVTTGLTGTSQTITGLAAGTYTFTYKNSVGCISPVSANATVNANPTVSVSPGGPTTFCSGGNVALTLTANGGSNLTYQWFKDAVPIGGATSNSYSATQSGTYTVKVTNEFGCFVTSSGTNVTVNPLPTASITNGAVVGTSCGGTATLTASTNAASASYQWYKNGAIVPAPAGTTNPFNATPPLSGSDNYTVMVTNTATGCSNTSAATQVLAPPSITANGSQTVCQGSSVVLTANAPTGNSTYQWNKDGVPISGETNNTYTATTSGMYTCTTTNNGGGNVQTTCPITVTVNPNPVPVISPATAGASACAPNPVPLSTATGFATYQWQLGGNPIPNTNTNTYNATQSGTYTVKVTDANGCIGTSTATQVTLEVPPATPIPTANTLNNVCPAVTVNLDNLKPTAASGTTLEWRTNSNPSMGMVVANPTTAGAGTYYLFAKSTTANGCYSAPSSAVIVVINPCAIDDSNLGNAPGSNVVVNILANDLLSTGSIANTTNTSVLLTTTGLPAGSTVSGNVLSVPNQGSWTYNPTTGDLTFDPIDGFTTDPTPITYVLTETATGLTDTALVTVTYTEIPPVATNDISNGNTPGQNAVVNLLANDLLSDGSPATTANTSIALTTIGLPAESTLNANGSVTVPGQGTWTYDPTTGNLTFDPIPGFTTDPTPITYVLTETLTGLTDTATVTVNYTEIPPVANNDSSTGNTPGQNAVVNLLTNDLLSDGSQATTTNTSVALTTTGLPAGSTLNADGSVTVPGQGTWTYNPMTGDLTFDPIPGFTTDPTPITYVLTETLTGLTDTAIVTVTYTEIPPVAENDSNLGNVPGSNVSLNLLTNDKLSDGSSATPTNTSIALTTIGLPAGSSITGNVLTVTGQGTWTLNPATGNLTFDPFDGFTTDPTPVTYILTETQTGLTDLATVTVTYNEIPPIANDDSNLGNVPGSNPVTNILSNDKLSDGSPATLATTSVTLTTTGLPAGSSVSGNVLTVPGEGSWTYNPATGDLTFDPIDGFTTDPTPITYILTETLTGLIETAKVTVTYTEIPPIANDDSDLGNVPGTNAVANILANDKLSDGSQATPANTSVTLTTTGLPAGSSVSGNVLTVPGQGTWTYNPMTGDLTFDPFDGFSTDPTPITYILTETLTGLTDLAKVTVTYTEIPPVAEDDSNLGNIPGTNVTENILANDLLSDGSPANTSNTSVTLTTAGLPAGSIVSGNMLTVPNQGTWTYNPMTGDLTFDPKDGFTTDPTPITYILTETQTGLFDQAKVTVTYTEIPPVATNDTDSGNVPGTNAVVNLLTNDLLSDGSPATTANTSVALTTTGLPAGSTLNPDGSVTVPGQGTWTYNPMTGDLTFDPIPGFTTDPTPITYVLTETLTGLTDTAVVTVTYTEIPPVATNDTDSGNVPGTNAVVNLLTNDLLSDGSPATTANTSVALTTTGLPAGSTLNPDGSVTVPGQGTWTYNPMTGDLTFDPIAGFTTDPAPITYVLTETQTGLTDTAVVTVDYTEAPPVGNDDQSLGNTPGADVTINILTNDKLADGSPALPTNTSVTLTLTGLPDGSTLNANGSVTVPGQGTWTYDPATGNLTFDPIDTFKGDPTPLTYILTETATGLIDASTVVIITVKALPVTLVNFNGNQAQEAVLLSWKIANEKDFSHFEIQKSSDSKEFGTIGTVNGKNSTFYNFTDSDAREGANYYRLKMIDIDGTSELSKIINVTFEKNGDYISVENPAINGQFKVMTNFKSPNFKLINGLSVEIPIQIGINGSEFMIRMLKPVSGLYYLNIENMGKIQTKKVLIP